MVGEVGVHDDDIGAAGELEAVDVGGAEAELAGARLQDDAFGGVELLELFGYCEGAVGGAVVDDDEFPVEFAMAGREREYIIGIRWRRGGLLTFL